MRTVRTVAELREELAVPRRAGARIGLVPTMGALHAGHISLIDRATDTCDVVVVSLFVNPAQFGPAEDLDAYPRDERRDAELASDHGADILFAPGADEVYPPGDATTVDVAGMTGSLCGAARGPEHFRGVTTVVAKLFNMAAPDVAFFGQKDAQQAVVIRRMARDLGFPVEIETCPTVREADGLALSSRNAYLSPSERERALALRRGLDVAERLAAEGERDASAILAAVRKQMASHGIELEYAELVDPESLAPVTRLKGDALVAVAARVGSARLIDNTTVRAADRSHALEQPIGRY